MNDPELTREQLAMVDMWDRHTAAEFETKDIEATMATMTDAPFVNHVPVMTGGVGVERIYWDQASVLAQVGLIDADRLPVTGAEASRKVLDPASEPSNRLIDRGGQAESEA